MGHGSKMNDPEPRTDKKGWVGPAVASLLSDLPAALDSARKIRDVSIWSGGEQAPVRSDLLP